MSKPFFSLTSTEEKVRVASRISKELDVRVRRFYATSSPAIPDAMELLVSSKELSDVKREVEKKEPDVKKDVSDAKEEDPDAKEEDPDVKEDEHDVNYAVIK